MIKSKRHVNIPIFIPHLGCPNQCIFCNQRYISGVNSFEPSSVDPLIKSALSTIPEGTDVEIAFFGGSFTGIDRDLMLELLAHAKKYIDLGRVSSIRCSTRPDYIDDEVLDILKNYGVKTVELGLQSASEHVLSLCKRGHTVSDAKRACELIVRRGFDLVGQMMLGLPGSSIDDEIQTARFIINSGASGARIYPTVIFRDTELAFLKDAGDYSPLPLDDAIERGATVLSLFVESGVPVIRIGLCSSENLADESAYYGGPNHPAIGEMIESRYIYRKIMSMCEGHSFANKKILVTVPRGCISKAVGHKKENKIRLMSELLLADISFRESDELSGYELTID